MIDYGAIGIPELPDRICVETRFVTYDIARLKNLSCFDLRSNGFEKGQPLSIDINPMIIKASVLQKPMVSKEVLTESPNPFRERGIQTELFGRKTIAIQCQLEKEELEKELENEFGTTSITNKPVKDLQAERTRFEEFFRDKTHYYTNGKVECLLCGEIKTNVERMEPHMFLHWGPEKLCFRCGICFEHRLLWKKHNCVEKRSSKQLQFIKCPHFLCAASVISPMELYDHINEHCGLRIHKCAACNSLFPTAEEYRYHLKLHKNCKSKGSKIRPSVIYNIPAENAKYRHRVFLQSTQNGNKFVIKTFLSQLSWRKTSSIRFCNICLRRCWSYNAFNLHVKRCLQLHKKRLKQKRLKVAMIISHLRQ